MNTLWVIVSNSAEARVYECARPVDPLDPVASLAHDESRQHPRDLIADKSGRVHDRTGDARHRMEPDHTVKEIEADNFAREIDEFLSAARQQGRYADLAVIAAPRFLGRLRERYQHWLPDSALVAEVAKDLTAEDAGDVRAELESALPPLRLLPT